MGFEFTHDKCREPGSGGNRFEFEDARDFFRLLDLD